MSAVVHTRAARFALPFALVFAIAACGDSGTTPTEPVPSVTVAITPVQEAVYEGDVIVMRASVRDRGGNEIPGATVTWSVSNGTLAEISNDGVLSTFRTGTVRIAAKYQGLQAAYDLTIGRLSVLSVTVLPQALDLEPGDVTPVGVRVLGEGGRTVHGRVVTIASDNPTVAAVDASGRVRAVSAGVATIRATADGVAGTARVQVGGATTILNLSRAGGAPLPILDAVDDVEHEGGIERREIYIEGGTLELSGGALPRYAVAVRFAEYAVLTVNGQRTLVLRHRWVEDDQGVVTYDARGDLAMTSTWVAPLSHTASPVSGGFQMRFRIPGDYRMLDLFYRREPR